MLYRWFGHGKTWRKMLRGKSVPLGHSMQKAHLYRLAELEYRPDLVRVCHEKLPVSGPTPSDIANVRPMEPPQAVAHSLPSAIQYAIVLNSINFQFWEPMASEGSSEIPIRRYAFDGVVGALGMQKALVQAWGMDSTYASFAKALSNQGVEGLFGDIPSPGVRERMLREVTARAEGKDDGMLSKVTTVLLHRVRDDRQLDVSDAAFLAMAFPSAYGRDPYLKRAQLALNFIAEFARHLGSEELTLDVTLFADYQVPRVARALGLLQYGPEMAQLVDIGAILLPGGRHERAIRAATVLLGRALAQYLEEQYGVSVEVAALDQWLWAQRNACGNSKFHRTLTTDY